MVGWPDNLVTLVTPPAAATAEVGSGPGYWQAGTQGSDAGCGLVPMPMAPLTCHCICCVLLPQPSDIRWASRWDTYLKMTDDQIHWFSIVNSVMIVLFLSGMVAMIMVRTLYRDISKYNQLDTQEDAAEETGWKLVSAVVWGCALWGRWCGTAPGCMLCVAEGAKHMCVSASCAQTRQQLARSRIGHCGLVLLRELLMN
jgi:hypothetical protein